MAEQEKVKKIGVSTLMGLIKSFFDIQTKTYKWDEIRQAIKDGRVVFLDALAEPDSNGKLQVVDPDKVAVMLFQGKYVVTNVRLAYSLLKRAKEVDPHTRYAKPFEALKIYEESYDARMLDKFIKDELGDPLNANNELLTRQTAFVDITVFTDLNRLMQQRLRVPCTNDELVELAKVVDFINMVLSLDFNNLPDEYERFRAEGKMCLDGRRFAEFVDTLYKAYFKDNWPMYNTSVVELFFDNIRFCLVVYSKDVHAIRDYARGLLNEKRKNNPNFRCSIRYAWLPLYWLEAQFYNRQQLRLREEENRALARLLGKDPQSVVETSAPQTEESESTPKPRKPKKGRKGQPPTPSSDEGDGEEG